MSKIISDAFIIKNLFLKSNFPMKFKIRNNMPTCNPLTAKMCIAPVSENVFLVDVLNCDLSPIIIALTIARLSS